MQHLICHKDTNDEIYLNLDIPVVSVNDEEINGLDYRDIDLLCCIVKSSPKSLTYSDIESEFLKKHNVACSDISDPLLYIRKKKHNIYRLICKKYNLPNLIDTVRSVGYRLNPKWEKKRNKPSHHLGQYFDNIGSILEQAISVQEKTPLIEKKDEDKVVIALDSSTHEDVIRELQNKYISSTRQLLQALNLTPFEHRYIQIEAVLNKIYSYVSMSRSGSGINHETWRRLFREELHHHFKMLIYIILNSNNSDS